MGLRTSTDKRSRRGLKQVQYVLFRFLAAIGAFSSIAMIALLNLHH
jgi:hypothetical protein